MPYNLRLDNVGYGFGDRVLFRGVSFSVAHGEKLVIAGRSGSGKSVLLEICAGLLEPHEGSVFINDRDVRTIQQSEMISIRQNMGVVFQKHALISNFTIFENIALPLRYHTSLSDKEIGIAVGKFLSLIEAAPLARQLPETLSFGQAKLVSIARALIMTPEVVLMDEPLSGLDPVASDKAMTIIMELADRKESTSIIVSNTMHLVERLRCPVVFINNGGISFLPDVTINNASESAFSLFMSGKV